MLEHSVVWFCRRLTVRAVAAAAVAALVSAGPSFGQQMDERWYEPTDWFEADDFVYDDDDYDDFDDFDDGYYVYDYDYDDRDDRFYRAGDPGRRTVRYQYDYQATPAAAYRQASDMSDAAQGFAHCHYTYDWHEFDDSDFDVWYEG